MCAMYTQEHTEARRDVGSPGCGATERLEPLCRCWALHPCPLQDQQVFLTVETFLQPFLVFLKLRIEMGASVKEETVMVQSCGHEQCEVPISMHTKGMESWKRQGKSVSGATFK